MCLAQGPQRSDAGEAKTRGPSVSSQAFFFCFLLLFFFKDIVEKEVVGQVLQETIKNFFKKSYKLFDEFLVRNKFYEPSLEIMIASQSCPTNTISMERLMAEADSSFNRAPNCNIYYHESKIMYSENNTSEWLKNQSESKRHELVTNAMKINNEVRNLEEVLKCELEKNI